MGADTTSTHLIFFIAATVVATATAGILTGVVHDLTGKATSRATEFGNELTSEIRIVNDPTRVTATPTTIFYVKNIGQTTLDHLNSTTIVDGAIVTTSNSLLAGETTFRTGALVQLTYNAALAAGDHRVYVVMDNGVKNELRFRV